MRLLFPLLTTCKHRCESAALHDSCLARCLFKTTAVDHRPTADTNPAASDESSPRISAFLTRLDDCRTNPGDQTDLPCDMERPMTDKASEDQSHDGWAASLPQVSAFEKRSASKRGFNDVVDVCIEYNCSGFEPGSLEAQSIEPGSLEFMRCVRQYHCM